MMNDRYLLSFCRSIKVHVLVFDSWEEEEFTRTEIMDYLEKCGYRICWHERDFMGGSNIGENIADATEHSRRIILVISR